MNRPRGLYLGAVALIVGSPVLTPVWWAWKAFFRSHARCVVTIDGEPKLHPGVAEGYQILMVAILAVGVWAIPQTGRLGGVWVILALYRVWEVLIYALKWFFVDPEVLHSYRRSALAFIVNLFELSAAYTVAGWPSGATSGDKWSVTFSNVGSALKLETPGSLAPPYATLFAIESWVLVVFVLACAVGGVQRKAEDGAG